MRSDNVHGMNDRETRTLVRAGVTLLVAAGVRWGVEGVRGAGGAPGGGDPRGGASTLATLDSAARAAADIEDRAGRPLGQGELIDPNRADVAELRRLPGVGEVVARALVASREAEGPYGSPEDLTRVRGVGPASVARLRPHLDFTRPPPASALTQRASAGRPDHASLLEAAAPPGAAEPLDPNRATAEALEELPGIGPALARRIVESRDADGPFRSVEELLRVRGIGPALLERIRPRLRVGGA
jgi:competence ComEA-like helix-hairpin-helix protein